MRLTEAQLCVWDTVLCVIRWKWALEGKAVRFPLGLLGDPQLGQWEKWEKNPKMIYTSKFDLSTDNREVGHFLWRHRAKNPFKTLKGSSSQAEMKSLTFWRGRERSVLSFLGKTAPPLLSCHLLPERHWMMHLSLKMKSSHGREWELGLFVTSVGDGGSWRPSYGAE